MEKTSKILKIVKIIFYVLIILTMIKSCASAYTWEDFIDFLSYSKGKETAIVDNTQKSYATYLINNSTSIKQAIINKGINVDDYDCFLVTQTSGYYYYIQMYKNITQYSIDSNSKLVIKGGQRAIVRTDIDGMYKATSNTANAGDNFSRPYGLVEGTPTNSNYYNACMQNIWVSFIARGTSQTYSSINEVLPLFDGLIGESEDYNSLEYKMYYLDTSNTKQYITANTITQYITQGTNGYVVTINSNAIGIPNGETIYLDVFKNNTLLTSSNGIIVRIERDTSNDSPIIENTSGNKFIDLTNTNNKIQEVTNAIISGDNKIISALESGEQKAEERQSFWENVYNTMFVPSGDFIENELQELKETLKISGDYSGEIMVLNEIKNKSGDFIISWKQIATHFSTKGIKNQEQIIFPSGEINFSKIVREHEELQEVMNWVRILLGFSLIILIIKQAWTLLLKTLGISTEVYEQHQEEQERLKKAEEQKKRKIISQLNYVNNQKMREYEKLARKRGWKK